MEKENIDKLVGEGKAILDVVNNNLKESIIMFRSWTTAIELRLQQFGVPKDKIADVKVCGHYKENKFSEEDSKKKLIETIENTIILLNKLENSYIKASEVVELSQAIGLTVIKRILANFHLHIKEMYQERVHGRGTLKQEDLAKIVIGNEYDVQRMLYSLLRPVFPTARLEVNDDTGYSGIRYDILLENYDTIIEAKCTRESMNERNLSEELAADGFHYKAKHIFMFIYDKEGIVKNTEAFKEAFKRDIDKFGKDIEVFIIQPVSL